MKYTETQYRLINLKFSINKLLNLSGASYEIGFTFGKGLHSVIYYYSVSDGKILQTISRPETAKQIELVMESLFESLSFSIPRNKIQ